MQLWSTTSRFHLLTPQKITVWPGIIQKTKWKKLNFLNYIMLDQTFINTAKWGNKEGRNELIFLPVSTQIRINDANLENNRI